MRPEGTGLQRCACNDVAAVKALLEKTAAKALHENAATKGAGVGLRICINRVIEI